MTYQMKSSHLFETMAQSLTPHNTDLLPRVRAAYQKEKRMKPVRRITAAILIVLLAFTILFLTVPDAAIAMRRIFGFIPGVGIVDQSAEIRVLAEPVSMTRDGITLTVEQAVLTSDKTVIIYKTEGFPQKARPKGESGFTCQPSYPTLLLPDETKLNINGGSGSGSQTGFYYPPIPADVDTVKFLLPCLQDVAPAAAPQDWELTLRFVPAPPDMTVVPIIEIATPLSTQPVPASVSLAESDSFMGLTYHLESMKRTDRGYIIETSIRWEQGLYADEGVGTGAEITLVDANGKTLNLHWLQDQIYNQSSEPRRTLMGFSMSDKVFTSPLTMTLPWVGANLPLENRPHFTFDPGPNPQIGQEWQVNQTIRVLGYPVKIISARFVNKTNLLDADWMRFMPDDIFGFEFTLEAQEAFRSIALTVDSGFSSDGRGTSGSPKIRDENGVIKAYAMMNGTITLPLEISVPYVDIDHPWQITWNPSDILADLPAPAGQPDIVSDASLQIEKVIPLEDGYYLIGRTNWKDSRISEFGIGGWDARLHDASGNEIPIEPADFNEAGILDIQPNQWIYKVYGKSFSSSLTLKMTRASLQFLQPYTFVFEPGSKLQTGQQWQLNRQLDILDYRVVIQSAKYVRQGDQHGFEFTIQADPALRGIDLNFENGLITDGLFAISGGGGSTYDEESGLLLASVLTNAPMNPSLVFGSRRISIGGTWQTTWNPPVDNSGSAPVFVQQACLDLPRWKRISANGAVSLPHGLTGKILTRRGALAPEPSLFVSNLDGSEDRGLVFGSGSISPDGARLIYSDENGVFKLMDIAAGNRLYRK